MRGGGMDWIEHEYIRAPFLDQQGNLFYTGYKNTDNNFSSIHSFTRFKQR